MSADYLSHLFGLEDQVAVVIGGTGVLGGAIAEGLASAGAHVVVAGRNEERGTLCVERIQSAQGSAEFITVDSCSRSSLTRLCDDVVARHERVDMLVNCAGANANTPYEEITDDEWNHVIDSNLSATHLACQVFAPQMTEQAGGGSILNIGSVTAHLPLSKVFAYSAAKAAIVNLTKNLAREFATRGVRINALCPGFFPAEQNRKLLTAERQHHIISQTPMARFGQPQELVGAVLLLLSRVAGSYITGADFYVDGGFTSMRF